MSAEHSIQSANGAMPVIVGEFGNSTDGANVDAGGTAAVQAVLDVAPQYSGYTAFTYYWPASWGGNAAVGADDLTNENTGALNAYGQQVAAAMSPSNRPISPTSPTSPASPANPALPASPNGTKITAASASPIIDQNGNSWSLVQSATASQGLQIACNGKVDTNTYNVAQLEILNGNIVQENTSGGWYQAASGSWTALSGNPNPVPSASGTTITSASAKPIIDQNGNSWSLVQSATASQGLQIACNGTVDTNTYNVAALEILNGNIVQENASGAWYQAGNGSWTALSGNPNPAPVSAPSVPPGGSDTLVLKVSED